MVLDKFKILSLIEEGYLMVNDHPSLPLRIYNYSRKTQFEKYWNEYTLLSRGLILDFDYNVVAMPFAKFFNHEEHKPDDIPTGDFEVYEKMDGSLGILFYYGGEWHVATRGSFASDQAIRAKEILKKYKTTYLDRGYTYLFEIIYPENRIVVNYGDDEKLVLLGMIRISDGYDLPYVDMEYHIVQYDLDFPLVKKYASTSIKELKDRNILNQEGYILRWRDQRRKVKFEDYCRLHSIITNISTKDIWACLRDGKDIDELLDNTPDEFDDWVREQVQILNNEYLAMESAADHIYSTIFRKGMSKKEFAEQALEHSCSAILFKIYEGKSYGHIIWRLIEPTWSKPFFQKQADDE